MADFEELKLTVTLVDDASAGLASIRTQLTQLTQTAGQVSTALSGVATSAQQVGQAHQQATPHITSQERALKELARSAEETTRGILQMGLAARRGAEAFPELALATREAWTGLKAVNAGMVDLAPAAAGMVRSLSMVALGVAGVGAAVVAYGVSVFKFSQEMYTLSQTAKSLGMTFGQLRSITEQNEKFGISTENTVGQIGKMNEALTDLSLSGSKLRQQLMSQGVGAKWIDQFTKETNDIDRVNKIREGQITVYNDLMRRGFQQPVARTLSNRFATQMGGDPSAMDRPALEHPTREQEEANERIAKQSEAIAEVWRQISTVIRDIKNDFLAWGLPGVLTTVEGIRDAFGSIGKEVQSIKELFTTIESWTPEWLKNVFRGMANGPGDKDTAIPNALRGMMNGPGNQRAPNMNPRSGYHPSSFEGANDNVNPLLHKTSFGDGFGGSDTGGSSSEGRAQAIIKGGVYEALIDFANYMRTGSTGTGGGGRGGVQSASFSPGGGGAGGGGTGGGGGGAGVAGFHSGGGFTLGGGNAAGSAGIPAGGLSGGTGGGQVPKMLGGGGPTGSDTGGPTGTTSAGPVGDPGVPSHILDQAKAVALQSGPGGVEAFMRSQGYPKAGNWCGEFAASVVKSSGGTPPQNPAIASNWRNWGSPVEGAPQPGDVAVRKGARTGATGSHVTFVENFDPKTGTFTGLGGNQGRAPGGGNRWESTQNASRYEFRRGGKVDLGKVAESAGVKGAAGGPGTGAVGEGGAGYLASKRAGFAKELEENPQTRKLLGAVTSSENPGAGPAVAESLMNRTEMVNETRAKQGQPPLSLHDMITGHGGKSFYGPVRSGAINEHLAKMNDPAYAARMNALTDQALGGSDTIKGYTDQGSRGDPNYEAGGVGININRERFNDWGVAGSGQWRQRRESEVAEADRSALSRPLDRSALNDNNKIHSTGKLDVSVNAPPGTKVNYHGQNLLKNTSMQRQTQMMPTSTGPSVGDTAQSYMRGGT